MKKRVFVPTLLGFALTSVLAQAQSAPLPPSSPAVVAPADAQVVVAPGAAQVVVAPAAPGNVRLHFHTPRDKGMAHVYTRQVDGRYALVCAAPCTADIPVGAQLRITYGDSEEEAHELGVSGALGSEVDVEVRGPSVAPVIGGTILMGVGGILLVTGAVLVAIGRDSSLADRAGVDVLGIVCMGFGVGSGVAGLVWLLSRSHEPRVRAEPYADDPYRGHDRDRDRRRKRRNRAETFLGDEASAKPVDALAPVGPSATPLRFGFSF